MKQMNLMMAALGISALVAFGGCKDDHDHDKDHGKDGHTKGDGHDHGDDDHGKDGHGHEHKGEKHDLGTQDVGGYSFTITQIGDANAGGEAILECKTPLPKGKNVKGVTAWLGDAAGVELSARAKADKHGEGDFDAHVRLPKSIPADAKFWIEATFADGKTAKASWAMKK